MVVKGKKPSGRILCVLLFGLAILQGCENSPKRFVEQAEQKFDAGDYLGAITYYEQVSENFPKNQMADDALYWAGIIHHLFLKDDDKALQAFQKLTREYPASPFTIESQSYIAFILERLEKTPQAIEAYEHLMEISPDVRVLQESHFKIGELYLEGGDLDQARNEWDALLKKYPLGVLADKALFGIASTFYIQGRCKEALNFLDRLINDHPESELAMDARFRAASCLEEEGRLQEALNRFREVVESYPNRLVVERKIKALAEQLKRLEGQKG